MNKSFFANNLKFLRVSNGIKTAEVPDTIGFGESQWNNYENDRSKPKFDDLLLIAKYFGVTESDLIHSDMSEGKVIENENEGKKQEKGKVKGKPIGKVNHSITTLEPPVGEPPFSHSTPCANCAILEEKLALKDEIIIGLRREVKTATSALNHFLQEESPVKKKAG